MKDLDSAGLACLAALADERSFERAAGLLSITQSAVSQRLRSLDASVGFQTSSRYGGRNKRKDGGIKPMTRAATEGQAETSRRARWTSNPPWLQSWL